MMENDIGYNVLENREDGTFVIELDGKPFHVTYEYSPEIFIALGGVVEEVGRMLNEKATE